MGLVAPLLLSGCAHVCVGTPFEERSVPGGQLLDLDIPLALIEGDPQAAGTARGQLLGPEAKDLLAEFTELAGDRSGDPQLHVLEAQTPPAYLEELRALAAASGIEYRRLLASNLLLDLQCTAVAAWGPRTRTGELIVGRNMDFPPAHLLGAYSLVTVVRRAGQRSYASIGWPGYTGVASGMNDAGVCAMILLNFGGGGEAIEGTPLAYRVRQVLERAGSLPEALEVFQTSPVGSGDFVLLCDANEARVVYQEVEFGKPPRFRVIEPREALLSLSNDGIDPISGVQDDDRACRMDDLIADAGPLDPPTVRGILGSVYLEYINCQAMLFHPAQRRLQLALGTTLAPASKGDWVELDLGPVLDGAPLEQVELREVETDTPSHDHYREVEPRGDTIKARTRQGYARELAHIAGVSDPFQRPLNRLDLLLRLSIPVDPDLEHEVRQDLLATLDQDLIALRTFAEDEARPLRERQVAAARLYWLSGFASIGGVGAVSALGEAHAPRSEELRKRLGEPPHPLGLELRPGVVEIEGKERMVERVDTTPPGSSFRKGDVIRRLEGAYPSWDAWELLRQRAPGTTVRVSVLRNGQRVDLEAEIPAP